MAIERLKGFPPDMMPDEAEQLFGKRLTLIGAELIPTLPLTGGIPLEALLDPDCPLSEILSHYWRGVRQERELHDLRIRNMAEKARREIRKALPIEESDAPGEGASFDPGGVACSPNFVGKVMFREAIDPDATLAQTEEKIELAEPFSETHPDLPESFGSMEALSPKPQDASRSLEMPLASDFHAPKPAESFQPGGDALPCSQFDGKPQAEAIAEVLSIAQSTASGELVSGEAPTKKKSAPSDHDWIKLTDAADQLEIVHQRLSGGIAAGKIASRQGKFGRLVRLSECRAYAESKGWLQPEPEPVPAPAPEKAPLPKIEKDDLGAPKLVTFESLAGAAEYGEMRFKDSEGFYVALRPGSEVFAAHPARPLPEGWALLLHYQRPTLDADEKRPWIVIVAVTCPSRYQKDARAVKVRVEGLKP